MYHSNLINLNTTPTVGVDFLWSLTALFSILCLVYMVVIFYTKSNQMLGLKRKKTKKSNLIPMVSEFLFFDEETATIEEKQNYLKLKIHIRQLLKNKRDRRVLADVLVELSQDLSGETLSSLYDLYKELGLEADALLKLKNWRWHIVSQGVLELTKMKVSDSYSRITKFVNDKRGVIRKQSVIAIVSLKDEGINYFLDTTHYKISEWQQLKLLEILQNKTNFNPPRFKNWLFSKNMDTVLFSLRLIMHYDQNDGNDAILQLVRHTNKSIRYAAIQCVGKFYLAEARDTLKHIFAASNNDTKLLIIEVLETLGFTEDVLFLKQIEGSNAEFAVKNKALSAINNLLPDNHLELEGLEVIFPELPDPSTLATVIQKSNSQGSEEDNEMDKSSSENEFEINIALEALADQNNAEPEEGKVVEEVEYSCALENKKEDKLLHQILKNAPIDDEKHLEFIQFMDTKSNAIVANIIQEPYEDLDAYQKNAVLAKVEELGDNIDDTCLEALQKNEIKLQLKERATAILNKIKTNNTSEIEGTAVEGVLLPEQSVFKDLYATADTETKLLLLDEFSSLGGRKELSLVKGELNAAVAAIRKEAARVMVLLEKRIAIEAMETLDNEESDKEAIRESSDNELAITIEFDASIEAASSASYLEKNKKNLLPMEYCFLMNDLEIKPPKSFNYFDIDFKLSEEFYLN